MKRLLCLLLALLTMLPLSACAGNQNPDTKTTSPAGTLNPGDEDTMPPTPVTTEATFVLPDVRYTGYTFTVANTFTKATKYTTNLIFATEQNGDVLNDAIAKRTALVEDKFDVKLEDAAYTLDQISNTLAAGTEEFALMTVDLSHVMNIVNRGYALDFYDIDAINLENPWWDHNAEAKLSFDGHLYYTFSDFLITMLDNSRATYFNKQMITDFNLENPYTLVRDGKWTFDKMAEMCTVAAADLNNDGRYSLDDRFGVISSGVTLHEALLTGAGAEIVQQGADGIPYFYCFRESERFVDVTNKITSLFTITNGVNAKQSDNDCRTLFMGNQSLFLCSVLGNASHLREMDTDFGILPVPKYDEQQTNYYQVSPNPHAMMIPMNASNLERTGTILEALSYYSSADYADKAVIPAYYELALKTRSSRDVDSAEMLDLIHDNISYVIKIVGTNFSDLVFAYMSVSKDLTSLLASQKNKVEKQLEETIANMRG